VSGGFVATPAPSVRDARGGDDMRVVRALFEEYAASLDVDLCFQGFATELASLPGAYEAPSGALLLAQHADAVVGCVALRRLGEAQPRIAEMKRLYVRPVARGLGVGRVLAAAVIERARAIGYAEIKLDTLASMRQARALYASLGFRACEPYYDNPLPGVAYLSLALATSAPTAGRTSASRRACRAGDARRAALRSLRARCRRR
jgi:ribosomal protein S18 acetylase RimI-like enzyme